MTTKQSLGIVILAPADRQELQHTLNSVQQAVAQLPQPETASIQILDESSTYDSTVVCNGQSIPVLASPSAVSHFHHVAIVPPRSMVSLQWLKAAVQQKIKQPGKLVRPALYVHYPASGQPVIRSQATPQSPLVNLRAPFLSGAVLVSGNELQHALRAMPDTYSVTDWLSTGLPWLHMASVVAHETAVFDRVDSNDAGANYRTAPIFGMEAARQSHIERPIEVATPVVRTRTNIRAAAVHHSKKAAVLTLRKSGLMPFAKRLLRRQNHRIDPQRVDAAALSASSNLPAWLISDWKRLHRLDNRIFPSSHIQTTALPTAYPDISDVWLAYAYQKLAHALPKNQYQYILFAPWLVRGGADKFTIEYANTVARNRPDCNVLVVTTLDRESEWANKLDDSVTYCNFAQVVADCPSHVIAPLLELLVGQSNANALHVINSELAYDFIASHASWLRDRGVRIAATSFSQEIVESGRTLGYSHSHMPEIYDLATVITSDNQTVLDMWRTDYGFAAQKLSLHHLPYVLDKQPTVTHQRQSGAQPFRVLWAARISVEKMPAIVADIGRLVQHDNITIDMYGSLSAGSEQLLPTSYPSNVRYLGGFNGLHTLDLAQYDAFLYTSLFDGMPNTLLEIGLHGLPIVSSAVGGIPELIRDNQTGLLAHNTHDSAAYAHALKQLQSNPAKARQLADSLQRYIHDTYSQQQFDKAVSDMANRLGL